MSVFQAVMPTGSYPSLTAGGVQCTQLYNNADLNDCVPENDKVFQAWVCTGNGTSNTMSNTPFANFGRTFYLTAVKTWYNRQNADKFSVTQTLYSVEPNGNSLIWTRAIDGAGTLGWSDWKEIVVADGSYPNLGAGYLAKRQYLSAGSTENIGWWKVGTLSIATFTQYFDNPSVIFVVNGIYPNQGYTNSVGTGLFELNARKNGSEWGDITISILCGNILPTDVCCVKTDETTVTLYYNCKFAYYSCKLTVLSEEAVFVEDPTEMFQFATEYYGTEAPANAVYGVVRNIASYVEVAKSAETLSRGVEIGVGSGETGWYKFMEASGLSKSHGYSAIILVNGVIQTQEGTSANVEESGIIEVDYYNRDGAATMYGVSILAGNLVPEEFCITASGNSISVYKNLAYAYEKVKFTELSLSGTSATTTYGSELESAAPANAVYAVVRNIASYAESIPAASQTVLGGAKMWVSNGKLYIKTT